MLDGDSNPGPQDGRRWTNSTELCVARPTKAVVLVNHNNVLYWEHLFDGPS